MKLEAVTNRANFHFFVSINLFLFRVLSCFASFNNIENKNRQLFSLHLTKHAPSNNTVDHV